MGVSTSSQVYGDITAHFTPLVNNFVADGDAFVKHLMLVMLTILNSTSMTDVGVVLHNGADFTAAVRQGAPAVINATTPYIHDILPKLANDASSLAVDAVATLASVNHVMEQIAEAVPVVVNTTTPYFHEILPKLANHASTLAVSATASLASVNQVLNQLTSPTTIVLLTVLVCSFLAVLASIAIALVCIAMKLNFIATQFDVKAMPATTPAIRLARQLTPSGLFHDLPGGGDDEMGGAGAITGDSTPSFKGYGSSVVS